MRTMRRLWLVAVMAVCACHRGGPPGSAAVPRPEVQLEKARAEFRRGAFRRALATFQRATYDLSPADREMAEARYFLAECYFQTGDLVQAEHEFRQVADQYAESPFAPVALLRAGDANLRLWKRPELDPAYGEAALAIYQELAGRYPGTDAAARAQLHVRQLREWFAEKTYMNGLFYFTRRAYDSAIIYFKEIVANYAEAPRAADALLRLVDTYRAIGYAEERRETCAHLWRYYPNANGLARSCPPDTGPAVPSP